MRHLLDTRGYARRATGEIYWQRDSHGNYQKVPGRRRVKDALEKSLHREDRLSQCFDDTHPLNRRRDGGKNMSNPMFPARVRNSCAHPALHGVRPPTLRPTQLKKATGQIWTMRYDEQPFRRVDGFWKAFAGSSSYSVSCFLRDPSKRMVFFSWVGCVRVQNGL